MWDPDSSGVTLTKPTPVGFKIDLRDYEKAIEWVRDHLIRNFELRAPKVLHDPYAKTWRFYDAEGVVIINLDHPIMERIALLLEKMEWLINFPAGSAEDLVGIDNFDEIEGLVVE